MYYIPKTICCQPLGFHHKRKVIEKRAKHHRSDDGRLK